MKKTIRYFTLLIKIEKELSEIRLQKSEFLKAQKYQEAGDLRPRENELVIKAIEIKKGAKDMPRITITKEDVEKILSLKTGIPTQVTGDEGKRLLGLENELKMQIIGQDEAVTKVAKSIRRNRAGLKDPNRPSGVFLFPGQALRAAPVQGHAVRAGVVRQARAGGAGLQYPRLDGGLYLRHR